MEKIERWLNDGYGSGYGSGNGFGDCDGSGNGFGDCDGSGYGSGDCDGSGYGYGDCDGSGDGYGSGYGSGYCSGDGYGYGFGSGNGFGDCDGSGYGFGDCDGSGDGSGDGYGSGYGSGNGYGSGYGSGNGYGYGFGDCIFEFNGQKVYYIDNLPTIIHKIHGNIALASVIENNSVLKQCIVAKYEGHFAHGVNAHDAIEEALRKSLLNKPVEERISEFISKFGSHEKVPAKELFYWHEMLTGSCRLGREVFCKEHDIDIQNDSFTIDEFIQLTRDSYGKNVIRELEKSLHKLK